DQEQQRLIQMRVVQLRGLTQRVSDQLVGDLEFFQYGHFLFRGIHGLNYFTIMPPDPKKIQALRASGTLNPRPEKLRDPRFADGQFFDPNDPVQLKYETLRAVEVDGQRVSQAAAGSGLSRPTLY